MSLSPVIAVRHMHLQGSRAVRNLRCLHTLRNNGSEASNIHDKEARYIHDIGSNNNTMPSEFVGGNNTRARRIMERDGSHVTFKSDSGMTTFLFVNQMKSR